MLALPLLLSRSLELSPAINETLEVAWPPPIVVPSGGMQTTMLTLRCISAGLCLILFVTIVCSSSIKRHSFVGNYLLLLSVGTMGSLITLFNAGGDIVRYPTLAVAYVQASSLFGWGIALAFSDLLLACLMLLKTLPKELWEVSPWVDTRAFERSVINTAPWAIWLIFFCAGLGLSISTAGHAIGHTDVFCVINLPNVKYFWNWTVVILLSLTVLVEIGMAILLLRTRLRARSVLLQVGPARSRSSQHITRLSSSQLSRTSMHLPPTISIPPSESFDKSNKWCPSQLSGLAVRVVALGAYFIVNAVLEGLVISGGMLRERVVVYESTRGIIIFIIFSSQHDIHTVYTSTLLSLLSYLPYSSRFLPTPSSYQTQPPAPSRPSSSTKTSGSSLTDFDVEKQSIDGDGYSINSGSSEHESDASTMMLETAGVGQVARNSFFTQRPFVIPGGHGIGNGRNKSACTLAEDEGEERKGGVKITVEVERFEED